MKIKEKYYGYRVDGIDVDEAVFFLDNKKDAIILEETGNIIEPVEIIEVSDATADDLVKFNNSPTAIDYATTAENLTYLVRSIEKRFRAS